jgi:hypothetical protein
MNYDDGTRRVRRDTSDTNSSNTTEGTSTQKFPINGKRYGTLEVLTHSTLIAN